MCDPISMTAATMALTIGTEVAALKGQTDQYNANAANAAKSMRLQNAQTNFAIQQQEAADSERAQQTQREMITAVATAKASAAESGTSGNSVDALFNEYYASEGRFLSNLARQQSWNRQQADVTRQSQSAAAERQINQVSKPDYIGAALRIAGSGLNSYDQNFVKPKSATPRS